MNSNWSYSLKHSIRVKIGIFLCRVSLKFYGWPRKKIGQLFYISSSFVHHFKAIGEFKLEIQSGNAQFRTKSAIFCPLWPWNLMNDLEKNRAPLLCCFRLCATFHSHQSIQNRVTVQKRPVWVKIEVICPVWPSNLTNDLENNRTPFYASSSFVHHFVAIGEFKLELQSGKRLIWVKMEDFFSPVTLKFDGWPWKTIGHLF